jgi:hypothetical protein
LANGVSSGGHNTRKEHFKATEEGNVLDEHEQWAKLRLIVEIAEEI